MERLGCKNSYWVGADWDPCFQAKVLNTVVPLVAVSISVVSLLLHAARGPKRLESSALKVGKLDPAASNFTIPHLDSPSSLAQPQKKNIFAKILSTLLPWNSSRLLHSNGSSQTDSPQDNVQAAVQVFRNENAVILNEVHNTPIDYLDQQRRKSLCRLDLARRIVDACCSVFLAGVHAGVWATGWQVDSYQLWWAIFWIYVALMSAYSLAKPHSLYSHKASMMIVYFAITLFNLRTALLLHASHGQAHSKQIVVLTSVQLGLGAVILIPTLFFPLQTRLPADLRSIYFTMSPEKQHGEPGTAIPSPQLHAIDIDAPASQPAPAVPDSSNDNLLSPPEETASLFSRAFFGFVSPAISKHYKIQFTMPAVPDLPMADKAAAVVAVFRAYTSDRSKVPPNSSSSHNNSRGRLQGKVPNMTEALTPSTSPLHYRLFRHFAGILCLQILWATFEATLVLAPPFFLNKILSYIAARDEKKRTGDLDSIAPLHLAILYAVGMLVGQISASISSSQALFVGRRICIRLRAILITEIVAKTLRRKDCSGLKGKKTEEQDENDQDPTVPAQDEADKSDETQLGRASDGQVVNLISVDVFKVSEICAYLHFLVPRAPLTIALCLAYLIQLLGWSAVLGFVILLASVPFQAVISQWFVRLQQKLLETTDKRLNLATEVLGCIKTVKFFAWERSFLQRMDETRQQELRVLARRYFAWLCNTFTYMGTPMIVTCVTFGAHTKIFHRPLTAETAFTALALFNTMRNPLDALPDMIVQVLSSLVSVRRIDAYLREEETMKYQQLLQDEEMEPLGDDDFIGFEDATFTYTDHDEEIENGAFCLKDLNIKFPVGKLSIIAGPVGSGKTTLLLAFLGETRQLSGRTFMPCPVARALTPVDLDTGLSDSVAYCSQSPWLLGTTVKENILFGTKYDEQRYRATVKACALEPDFKVLEYGDETEVGEKGTSLSGGQKARIALARAFYSSAKHILIDDALSAVDSHTANHLYRNALKGPLAKGRTILLVTHAISLCLKGAAFAVALDNGRVIAAGSPDEVNATDVFAKEGEALQHSLKQESTDADNHEEMTIEQLAAGGTDAADRDEMQKKLEKKQAHTNEETYSSGSVGTKNYSLYLTSVSTSWKLATLMWSVLLVIFFCVRMLDVGAGAWLMLWARSHEYRESTNAVVNQAAASSLFDKNVLYKFMTTPMIDSVWSTKTGLRPDSQLMSILSWPFISKQGQQGLAFDNSWVNNTAVNLLKRDHVVFDSSSLSTFKAVGQDLVQAGDERSRSDLDTYYLSLYLMISMSFVFAALVRDGYEFWLSLRASRTMYRKLTDAILNAKPQFFDRTPVGRIMNRLSKDIETVDQEIAVCLLFLLDCTVQAAAILALICWATPLFLLAAVVIVFTYVAIGSLYLVSSRDLKRIESVERSPIYTVVGEVLAGCVTIRAYGDSGRFTRHTLRLIDKANRAFFFLWYENRWLSVRVDMAGASVAFLASIFLLMRDDIEASKAGFILAYAITFVEFVLWIVRMYTQTEINMNSVERINEYLSLESEKQEGVEPPAYWPSSDGSIVIDNLSVRYTPEFPRVLDGINLEIKPREKVGIVGRTGSGKSTLALCFFRFLEAEEGSILIDGIDISKVPMSTLRQRLTVIPQDAQLFSGTVRSNLDPFNVYDDGELWTALQRCRLASLNTPAASRAASRGPSRPSSPPPTEDESAARGADEEDKTETFARTNVITSLDQPVEQGGRNFSAGQKQLLALARGLLKLRDSRILLLDESTANLDSASDAQIQKTIRQEMAPQATIITIAHRIKTIADYDKIVVLGKGKVIEVGSPKELMDNEESVFHSMCQQSGEMSELKRIADDADRLRSQQK